MKRSDKPKFSTFSARTFWGYNGTVSVDVTVPVRLTHRQFKKEVVNIMCDSLKTFLKGIK